MKTLILSNKTVIITYFKLATVNLFKLIKMIQGRLDSTTSTNDQLDVGLVCMHDCMHEMH